MLIEKPDHHARAKRLEERVFDEPADTSIELRREMGERAAGGAPIASPYDDLARDVGEASYRVTDAEVSAVRAASGSDRAAFELVAAAAVGAALKRWKAGIAAIDEATK